MNIITKKKRSATSVRKDKEGGKYIGGKKNPPMIINWLICSSDVLIFQNLQIYLICYSTFLTLINTNAIHKGN